MAFTTSFDRPAKPLGIRDWMSRRLDALRIARRRSRELARVRHELSSLSDTVLQDIGIDRSEIDGIARRHASS